MVNLLIPTCRKVKFGYLVPEVFPHCSRRKWLIGGLAVAISISIFHGVLNLLFHVRLEPSPVMFGFSLSLSFMAVMCMCLLASLEWA